LPDEGHDGVVGLKDFAQSLKCRVCPRNPVDGGRDQETSLTRSLVEGSLDGIKKLIDVHSRHPIEDEIDDVDPLR
jgi:hypothetical protein